jgi:hypothetical protein
VYPTDGLHHNNRGQLPSATTQLHLTYALILPYPPSSLLLSFFSRPSRSRGGRKVAAGTRYNIRHRVHQVCCRTVDLDMFIGGASNCIDPLQLSAKRRPAACSLHLIASTNTPICHILVPSLHLFTFILRMDYIHSLLACMRSFPPSPFHTMHCTCL